MPRRRPWTEGFGRRAGTRALGGGLVCSGREGGETQCLAFRG